MWEYNYDCEMLHSGTKGMKWGQRLYQHKDGTLTLLGRLRYGKKVAERRKAAAARAKAKEEKAKAAEAEKKAKETIEQTKQAVLKSRSPKQLYKYANLFDDNELKTAYNRLNLEKDILNLSSNEVSKGEKFVSKAIEAGKTLNSAADESIKIYNNVARVYNAFSSSGSLNYIPNAGGGKKKKDKDKDKD